MGALCEFGAYKSEGKQVKPRDFLWSIMFSGILISVRDHPYSMSAKRCVFKIKEYIPYISVLLGGFYPCQVKLNEL